ncbi:MAG: TlpA disulfide reductase family protein [Gemmatimonadota bacterium]
MRFALPAIRLANWSLRVWLVAFSVIAASAARPFESHGTLAAQDVGIAIGEKAPGGPLQTLDGKDVDLKQYLGKGPVVLEFWATWCGNCKQLEPAMRAAMAKYGKQATFVTVAVSVNQSRERVAAWQKINKIPGVLLYDRKGEVSGAYDVPATSYVVVVDKTGKIVYTGTGGTQNLDAAIKKAF